MKIDPRSVAATLAALAVLGLIGAAAVVFLGLFNVSAKKGHLPGVSWVLHTTFRNSVDLRAPPVSEAPNLSDPDLIGLGAKHFNAACRVCHSAPGHGRTATMLSMLPQPPHITDAVGHWTAPELHWIVHEGVKMSGMPAWPAEREDDVWAVVAFLEEVGSMAPERYDELTGGIGADPETFEYCASCHGANGVSGNQQIPRLDILSEEYMTRSLASYRESDRDSGIMQHASSEVAPEKLSEFARRFAEARPEGEAALTDRIESAGAQLATMGSGSDVPACVACHGPWSEPLSEAFPSLSGQYAPYLAAQLRLWRAGRRGGGEVAELMYQAARDLDDAEIDALAAYYAALAPAKLNPPDAP
ncbi:cytochrome c553 [Palleronia aestuarii]|uniref:Cytochrome c553 n=1 Tax=Palleronia aestuarii TaxID=568105 RepID=A0A2W7NEF2_9RHOB|nr:c-type cytochrome [Palleronia aestuarii]PZX18805.1 cytochrome c553 [Palleronia aestuarii]